MAARRTLILSLALLGIVLVMHRAISEEAATSQGRVLIAAVGRGDAAAVRELIRRGADVNRRRKVYHAYRTPLWHAVIEQKHDIIPLLLDAGAEVDRRDWRGKTPLMYASWTYDTAAVRALLAHGADAHARDAYGKSALIYANGHPEVVKLLTRAGARD